MSKKKILIIIDMQNDFIDGALGTPEAQAIVPRVVEKIESYKYDYIIATRDIHDKKIYMNTREGRYLPIYHCLLHTEGSKIPDTIMNVLGNYDYEHLSIISKSDFAVDDWVDVLLTIEKRQDVPIDFWDDKQVEFEFCGLVSDICLISNILAFRSINSQSEITVDASCCAGTTPEAHKAALTVMKSCQINVINED